MGGAEAEGIGHDVEIPPASRDDRLGCVSWRNIILVAEVIWAFSIIWRIMETIVGTTMALEIPGCDYVKLQGGHEIDFFYLYAKSSCTITKRPFKIFEVLLLFQRELPLEIPHNGKD